MQNNPHRDTSSSSPHPDTAQPSLTSGFGAVIEKEQSLQGATEGALGCVGGAHAAQADRILRHQNTRLGANIALLQQRYESLPLPERFLQIQPPVPAQSPPHATGPIADLLARHNGLLAEIETLIDCAPDGQRGELILREVSRNHDEMAWMLTALLREDESVAHFAETRNSPPVSVVATRAHETWDNEGGALRTAPAAH